MSERPPYRITVGFEQKGVQNCPELFSPLFRLFLTVIAPPYRIIVGFCPIPPSLFRSLLIKTVNKVALNQGITLHFSQRMEYSALSSVSHLSDSFIPF